MIRHDRARSPLLSSFFFPTSGGFGLNKDYLIAASERGGFVHSSDPHRESLGWCLTPIDPYSDYGVDMGCYTVVDRS
jgi:hypothetical protein